MTETEIKLEDAKIQLEIAIKNNGQYNVVRSCINAFISNARSVTFTMQKEFNKIDGFNVWYQKKQDEMSSNVLFKFFNEQRKISIHHHSISPNKRVINIKKIEKAGKIIKNSGTVSALEFPEYRELVPGDSGNVFRLCKEYIKLLQRLVSECKDKFVKK